MDVRKAALGLIVIGVLIVGVVLFLFQEESIPEPVPIEEPEEAVIEEAPEVTQSVIGVSVEGREIEVFTFGTGERDLLFVGGIHGGYEWNSALLAYEFIDRFTADDSLIPEGITVHIIPDLNPDATAMVHTGESGRFAEADLIPGFDQATARFNANGVDLNRNFDCKWQSESSWRGKKVSAGTSAFSEPEAVTLRNYVMQVRPEMVAMWHSQANNVYASECENGVLPETLTVMQLYADAANYGAVPVFDAYPVTGDAEGWLASIGVPAITVELSSHESLDWERNVAALEALFAHYAIEPALPEAI